jgi:hypothetical protein
MPLSIDRLNQLLEKKGFTCRHYYVIGGNCKFIEILSINTIDSYLLHIPEKYSFEPRTSDQHLVSKLKTIQIENSSEVEEKYAGGVENSQLTSSYDEIELKSQYPHQMKEFEDIDMEANLTSQYKRPIILKDVAVEDNAIIQCIFRQLTRLRYCVQFLKYKFSIVFRDYLVTLNSKSKIECYKIKHNYNASEERHLYITIDLEVFYENSKILLDDLDELQNGVRAILDKNQQVQTKHLEVMLTKQQELIKILEQFTQQKQKIRFELQRFKELFTIVENAITSHVERINEITAIIPQTSGSKQDELIKNKHSIYIKLTQLYNKKEEIAKSIIFYRKNEHHISLNIDRILFDNNIMLDKIFKNLHQLHRLNQS